jgi:amidase
MRIFLIALLVLPYPLSVAAREDVSAETRNAALELKLMRERMATWEPRLHAVIMLNPELDKTVLQAGRAESQQPGDEHAGSDQPGPLAGLPVLLKDNIESREMPTTAGSLALQDNVTGRDAELTRRLRAAGLVIAGKTNLSEWANFRDSHSTSGWSAVGGLTPNAWDETRSACGSSSGSAVAVAAGYVPFAVATETNGSIVCPASYNGIVGIKPTVGLVSRRGIVPISHSQDTAGPMAMSVKLAALLLSAMEGEDESDPATVAAHGHFGRDYLTGLTADSLKGMKIGVIRLAEEEITDGAQLNFERAVEDLKAAGALLVETLSWPKTPKGFDDASFNVLLYEFKHDLNAYLATLPGEAGQLTLARLIEFNQAEAELEMPWFGQDIFIKAQEKGDLESKEYLRALKLVQSFTRSAIDGLLAKHDVDLLVTPTNSLPFSIDLVHGDTWYGGTSSMAAIAGYPHITVPSGKVKGLPTGLSFIGAAFSEPVLIRAAYGYEQATHHATTLAGDDPWGLANLGPE